MEARLDGKMQLRLSHKALIFSAVLLFELVLVAIFAGRLGLVESELRRSHIDNSIIFHLDSLQRRVIECELAAGANDPSLKRSSEWIPYEFGALRQLMKDNPGALSSLNAAESTINSEIAELSKLENPQQTGGRFDAARSKAAFDHIATQIQGVANAYRRTLTLDPKVESRHLVENYLFVFIVLNAMVAVATSLYFMQGIAYRVGILTDNSIRFAKGQNLHPRLEGSDEIAQLDRTIHETIRERIIVEDLLRKSEARTRSLIENMPIGIVTIDEKGVIESINPRTEEIFGYSFEEINGDHFMALFCLPNDMDVKAFKETICDRALKQSAILESRRKNGELFPVEMTLTEYDSVDGKRFLANIQDITERRRAERLRQELLAMVSHDLRSPLTSVQGVMTLLSRGMYGKLSETGEQRVKVAEISIGRLIKLVDDILDLERMEAGKLQFNHTTVTVSSIIDRSIESVYDFAQQASITFQSPQTDAEINVDEDRLVQVVVNLLSNAIKFSPPGSLVKIGVNELPGEVEVSVEDQGPGIAEEDVDSLFQRFHQLEYARGVSHKGAGLGLAICKAIVEGHGGSIGVSSEPGAGSKFWFRVPNPQTLARPTTPAETILTS
jgi:PAS domain S-box-containing protein